MDEAPVEPRMHEELSVSEEMRVPEAEARVPEEETRVSEVKPRMSEMKTPLEPMSPMTTSPSARHGIRGEGNGREKQRQEAHQ
jgi:hypothetical protein